MSKQTEIEAVAQAIRRVMETPNESLSDAEVYHFAAIAALDSLRGDQITPEEAEAAASKLEFGGAIDGGLHWFEIADHAEVEAADRAEAKLRRLASLHPDEKGSG